MKVTINPGRAQGNVLAPPSKSMAHRLLMGAGLAGGTSVIQNIDLSEATITGFDNSVVGKQTLTVEYMGVTCSLVVNVVEKRVTGIEIYEMPKTTYIEGQKFDPSNGKLKVNYNDKENYSNRKSI